jgi:hypothetical protein
MKWKSLCPRGGGFLAGYATGATDVPSKKPTLELHSADLFFVSKSSHPHFIFKIAMPFFYLNEISSF